MPDHAHDHAAKIDNLRDVVLNLFPQTVGVSLTDENLLSLMEEFERQLAVIHQTGVLKARFTGIPGARRKRIV